ncbi:SusD/RagB family nutrient-binding outer membrane lipoprotein [Bacteroides sp. K03]|uniref:SusD/RagB family nutrient-binding outer membrane lipoprotein n=1 Tax=unclassified Bacteroides TaxID=2646097 RepID=UPI001C8CF2EA|nr:MULTISPECIES: SusD/RagB family nutrient-binding outer membrane lipoprotein [unclassified Bacteroides]MBX9188775.1 SusD/RagB family nutrient-binding outer membrane lipoprotein [Bacteroides sp. K03]
MRRKNNFIYALLLISIALVSCEDYLNVNRSKDNITTVTPELILPVLTFYAAQTNYDHAEYNMYLAQAFTTGGKAQVNSTAYKGGWEFLSMNRHPQWRRHYYDIGVNLNEMLASAKEAGYTNFPLIGRTIRLMSTQLTTDVFGDMPRTTAYTDHVTYDTQESIYEWMLSEVEDLLAQYNDPSIVNSPANISITKSMDRIFSGDLKKWRQFTYALKARILLRKLPNWDNTQNTCDQIINSVNAALEDWEEPNYKFDGGVGEANCPWGPAKPKIGGWESRSNDLDKTIPSKYLMVDMFGIEASPNPIKGYAKDPRMEALMKPRKGADGRTIFRYLDCNIGMDASAKESHYPDLYCTTPMSSQDLTVNPYTKNDGYVPLFLTEELMLIKAEALYWRGDKTGAREWTIKAVEKSFERFNCNTKYTEKYLKNVDYLPEIGFNIGHIMRQKYVCMYLQPEIWTDMRRYNYSNSKNNVTYDGVVIYPNLKRPYNLYEPYWCIDYNPDGTLADVWVQRLNYDPETEEKYSRLELERLGAYKNPEWLKKPMIWGIYNGAHK